MTKTFDHDFSAVIDLTHDKTASIAAKHPFKISGFVLKADDGRHCIVSDSAVRWFHGPHDFFHMMQAASPWIATANHLPDADITVLMAFADGDVFSGLLTGDDQWHYVTGDPVTGVNPTHWMHLPPAPEDAA